MSWDSRIEIVKKKKKLVKILVLYKHNNDIHKMYFIYFRMLLRS